MTTFGTRPNGVYVPRFRNVGTRHPAFLRGYGFQADGCRRRVEARRGDTGLGRRRSRTRSSATRALDGSDSGASASAAAAATTSWRIHPTLKDKWGIPALDIHAPGGPTSWPCWRTCSRPAAEMLEAGGSDPHRDLQRAPGTGPASTRWARRGWARDPKTSVLNSWNQSHDVPNVFVTDGACMTSSANQNPSHHLHGADRPRRDLRDRGTEGRTPLADELEADRLANPDRVAGRGQRALGRIDPERPDRIAVLVPTTRNVPVGSMLKARGVLPPVGTCCSRVSLPVDVDGEDHDAVVAAVRAVEELAGRVQQHLGRA